MPRHDGTGPQGSGKPGQGKGHCHSEGNHEHKSLHHHKHGHHHGKGCCCEQHSDNFSLMYDFTEEELNNRKKALQKEMQWLEARIKELGETHENSNTIN